VEVRFLLTFRVVEICVYVFLVSFLFVLTGRFSLRSPVGRRCSGSSRRQRAWPDFHLHLYFFETRSTLFFVSFCETRVPLSCSPSSSGLVVACIGRAGHQWPMCDHHTFGILFSLVVHDIQAPSFLDMQWWGPWIWGPICCRVTPRMERVLHAPFSNEDNVPCRRLGLSFFCLLCLCIPFVSPVTICLCIIQFYWNICWPVARSTIFSFWVCVIVKRGSNVVLVRFVFCLDNCF